MELLAQNIRELEGFGIAAFTDETNVHPLGLTMLIIAAVATFAVPRRYALIPFFLMMTLIPSAQRIAIFTLDFPFLRILVVTIILRAIINSETGNFVWVRIDKLFFLWTLVAFVVIVARTGSANVVYQCGITVDAVGGYFGARFLIRDWSDLRAIIRAASLVAFPVALLFVVENYTQRNLFSMFGGVHEITIIRDGRLRCQGPYNHPILAGCYWAALLPLMASRWWDRGSARIEVASATVAALIIVYCCASSTPVFGVVGAIIGAFFFGLRDQMRGVRWALAISIVALHLVMKAPVWHLISRVSAVGGSTSYFRYLLLDSFINRFSEWAPLGVDSTAHWFWGAQDLTNYYVAQGVGGGLATVALFVAIIVAGFGGMGLAWRRFGNNKAGLALAWALGVSLLVHVFNFFGVSYFGTITGLWYLTLGAMGSLSPTAALVASRAPCKSRLSFSHGPLDGTESKLPARAIAAIAHDA